MFASMNMELYELRGDVRLVKAENEENKRKLRLTGGRLQGEMVVRGNDLGIDVDGENSLEFSNGEMVFLDFAFQPTDKVSGQATVNILANVADKRDLEFTYGDRGLPLVIEEAGTIFEDEQGPVLVDPVIVDDRNRVEVYDFNAKYEGENVDVEAFYHTPRFHWGYEGDHFGLLREATDIAGIDIWDQKAPAGVEVTGKGKYDGVTLLFGPEVYWGANPKFIFKYDFKLANFDWTFIHSEDLARRAEASGQAEATGRQSRQTTLTAEREFSNGMKLELGGIWSANEKVDEVFDRVDRQTVRHRCFACICLWHHHCLDTGSTRLNGHREYTSQRANTSVQREFTQDGDVTQDIVGNASSRRDDTDCDWEVERRAFFLDVGGSEVDGDTMIRKQSAAVLDRSLDAIVALAHRTVG